MKKTIIKFGAQWCSPCGMLAPIFEKVANELTSENLTFEQVDVDDNFEIAEKYNIRGVPTILLVDENDNELKRHVGFISENKLKEFVNEKETTEIV